MKRINKITLTEAMGIDTLAKSIKDVYNLSAGDPNLDLSPEIINSYNTIDLQTTHNYCGSQGIEKLRKLINPKNSNQVIIANGAKQLIYMALQVITNPKDEVILIGPCWTSYIKICEILNLNYKLLVSDTWPYIPSIEQIKNTITKKTSAILINNPNNPTGIVYDKEYLDQIVELSNKHNFWIVSDEIYDGYVYKKEFYSLKGLDNVIYINGFSKSYSLTGWRLGYAIANEEIINAMVGYQSQISGPPSTLIQNIIADCYDKLTTNKEEYKKRVDALKDIFKEYMPDAGFYLYIPISKKWKSSTELCKFMLERYKIALTPGDSYGIPNTVRISIANISLKKLKEIKQFLIYIIG